jgi:hypothetical protein
MSVFDVSQSKMAQFASEHSIAALHRNQTTFGALVDACVAATGAGAFASATMLAELAAHVAWRCHPGEFASRAMEQALETAGQRFVAEAGRSASRGTYGTGRRISRVLHVVSSVYSIGGHTKLCRRWIELDTDRRPTVALLRQEGEVPDELLASVAARRGWLVDLTRERAGLATQARVLANLAAEHDVVVLHIHPDDPVPNLALAHRGSRPPTIFVNHAGRSFSLGLAVADVVAWLRPATRDLCVSRRGVPHERLAYLPIPIDPPMAVDRDTARERCGLPRDALVILTVAHAYKYYPVDGRFIGDLIVPLLDREPRAILVAVGPQPEGPWARAEDLTDGRVRAVGPQRPLDDWYASADIYLDSFPLSSETCVREAALAGLAIVSFAPFTTAPVASVDLPGEANGAIMRADTEAELVDCLGSLASNVGRRERVGRVARDAIRADGTSPGWNRHIEMLYRRAIDASPMSADALLDVAPRFDDVDVLIRAAIEADRGQVRPGDILSERESLLFADPSSAARSDGRYMMTAADALLRSIESRLGLSEAP